MDAKLEKKLMEEFPTFFKDMYGDMTKTCMHWGCAIGDGWFDLLYDTCKKVAEFDKDKKFYFLQIKEKFGCYDKETLLLTNNGWKYFKDLNSYELIATLNSETNNIEYHKPSEIISYKYNGKMYHLSTRGVSLCVTPNHNLYVSKGDYYNGNYKPPIKVSKSLELVTPDKYFGKNKRFKKSANWGGNEEQTFTLPEISWSNSTKYISKRTYVKKSKQIPMDEWLNFLGWYVAEGCDGHNEIAVSSNNTDGGIEKEIISNTIKSIGYEFSESMTDRPACTLKIYDKQLNIWLKNECGHLAQNKKVPEFIKNLSSRQIRIFLKSLYAGDANKMKTGYVLSTSSISLAYDVLELLLKIGDCGSLSVRTVEELNKKSKKIKHNYNEHTINWLQHSEYHNTANKGMAKGSIEEWVDYDDYVYCVNVPNHIIYVCRNGKPVWCGNSLRLYCAGGNEAIYKITQAAEDESYKTCEECGVKENITTEGSWIQTLCKACRSKNT